MVRGGVDAVEEIDRRALGARLGAPPDPLDRIWRPVVDGFALDGGYAHVTVVLDLEGKRVVGIGPGWHQDALRGFCTAL